MASAEQLDTPTDGNLFSAVCTKESQPNRSNETRPKLFYSCGHSLLIITHYFCGKARQLPFPFGQLAAGIEHSVGSWMLPVIVSVECQGLRLLTVIDNQLCVMESVAEHILPPLSVLFDKAQKLESFSAQMPDIIIATVDNLAERGLVGCIADLWVKYEAELKDQTKKVLKMTHRVPLLNSITTLMYAVVTSFAGMVSCWMLKHSEAEVKDVSPDNSGAKDVTVDTDYGSKHVSGNEHLYPEKTEPLVGIHDDIALKNKQHSGKTFQRDDHTKSMETEGKGIPAPIKVVETPPDPLLELFDSSWHMKPSLISPKQGLSLKPRSGK
eukprot:Gb_35637 [translate_table: standard]